jgi:hypothetical protein
MDSSGMMFVSSLFKSRISGSEVVMGRHTRTLTADWFAKPAFLFLVRVERWMQIKKPYKSHIIESEYKQH